MLDLTIQDALAAASDKIGEVRAVIALQAVLHRHRPLRIIDGKISQETLTAASVVGAEIGADEVARLLNEHIQARFPELFVENRPEEVETASETEASVETQPERVEKPKRKRHRTP